MAASNEPPRSVARLSGAAVLLVLSGAGAARGFPLIDTTTQGQGPVPAGAELAAPDAQDLQHQLQLANGLRAATGGGWVFQPRLDVEEMFTDNIYQVHSPRRWDVVNYIAPGISLAGDMPRIQVRLDYAPSLALYDRTGTLNALTQQLNGTASVTVVPELFYIDARALAGVQSRNGGIGGVGGLGTAGGNGLVTASNAGATTAGTGLNKQNEVQTTSAGISPYLVGRFGDWGNGRLGASLDVSRSNSVSGFTTLPLPTGGGSNSQSLVTTEQTGQFVSGDVLDDVQNTSSFDLTQSSTDAGQAGGTTAATALAASRASSSRQTLTDQVTYAFTHELSFFGSMGYENIRYSGANSTHTSGLTWRLGGTWVPNPDSSVTLSYGHQEGQDSFAADAHYALTARTVLNASYSNTLGTQLENLQRQLNQAAVANNGSLVNSQTGAPAVATNNAQAVQPGLYRFSTLEVGTQTLLDRDMISFAFTWSHQTATGNTAASNSSDVKTVSAQWVRQLWPDLTWSSMLSYSDQSATAALGGTGSTSIAGSAMLQYIISETVTGSLRYSFFERSGGAAIYSMYQNLVIVGITKTF
jgi:uncharacterized protein (PEP-CTERM system associated)